MRETLKTWFARHRLLAVLLIGGCALIVVPFGAMGCAAGSCIDEDGTLFGIDYFSLLGVGASLIAAFLVGVLIIWLFVWISPSQETNEKKEGKSQPPASPDEEDEAGKHIAGQ